MPKYLHTKFTLLLFLSLTLLVPWRARGQTTLLTEDFETNGEGVRYNGTWFNSLDPNDVMFQTNANPAPSHGDALSGLSGTGFIYSEDVDGAPADNPNDPLGILTLNSVNVSGFSSLAVKIKLGEGRNDGRAEADDKIEVQAQLDGGTFVTIGRFQGNPNFPGLFSPTSFFFTQDVNLNGVAEASESTALSSNMTDYTFPISGTGNNLVVRVVITTDGGTEELAFDHIRVEGTAASNDPPVIANIEAAAITYTEGDPATQITNTITISDPDDVTLSSATVSIISGLDVSEDILGFTPSGGVLGSYDVTTGVLSLTGNVSLAAYQTVLRSVTYLNTDGVDPSPVTRTVQFVVNDGTDGSNFLTRNINITTAVNPPAALPICESFETDGEGTRYTSNTYDVSSAGSNCDFFIRTNTQPACHGDAVTGIDGTFYWASEDVISPGNGNVPGTLQLSPLIATGLNDFTVEVLLATSNNNGIRFEADDALFIQYNFDGGAWTTVGAFYGAAGGANLVQDADLNGVPDVGGAALNTTLTNFVFNFNGAGTDLNVRVVVDQDGGSEEIIFDNICVNGTAAQVGPTLANIEGTVLDYTEGDGAIQITNSITISDPDDVNLEGATVTICNGFVGGGEDFLFFSLQPGIGGLYNSTTGVLTLSGTAPLSSYQTVLRSVQYLNNNTTNPDNTQREICFVVNDGDDDSNIASRNINVIETLNAPASLPFCESFETDGDGTRYESGTFDLSSGVSNCDFFIRTNTTPACFITPITGADGSFYWASEDVGQNGAGGPAALQLAPFDATGLGDFQIELLLAISPSGSSGWETDDAVLIQYNMDGGAWITVGAFYGNNPTMIPGDLVQDADLDGVADVGGAALTSTLTNFVFPFTASGSNLNVRVLVDQTGGSEELAFDNFCVSGSATTICPTIGAISFSDTVCVNDPFDITATGLADMDSATNGLADFGIEFIFSASPLGDPYTGGTSLGTVPFASLTAGNTVASLLGASIPLVDNEGFIYAILTPDPSDPSCRPSVVDTITVSSKPTVDVPLPKEICFQNSSVILGPLTAPVEANTVYSGPGVTDNGNGNDFTLDVPFVGVGVHPVTVTQTNANGCERVDVVNVTVNPTDTTNVAATTCDPGQVGIVQQTLSNQFGCDSVVITNTTLLPSDTTNVAAQTCDPAQEGVVQMTFTNQFGCDSIVITTTTLLPSDTTNVAAQTCDPAQEG
ncbi:MAG: hypothetical protein AAF696_11090, partial [Bacteroidota bacterium]